MSNELPSFIAGPELDDVEVIIGSLNGAPYVVVTLVGEAAFAIPLLTFGTIINGVEQYTDEVSCAMDEAQRETPH